MSAILVGQFALTIFIMLYGVKLHFHVGAPLIVRGRRILLPAPLRVACAAGAVTAMFAPWVPAIYYFVSAVTQGRPTIYVDPVYTLNVAGWVMLACALVFWRLTNAAMNDSLWQTASPGGGAARGLRFLQW